MPTRNYALGPVTRLNGELDREHIHEKWLNEELCVRFGFCGKEYDSILNELTKSGRKKLVF